MPAPRGGGSGGFAAEVGRWAGETPRPEATGAGAPPEVSVRKIVAMVVIAAACAVAAPAAVFERFLAPDDPRDQAIVRYLVKEKEGRARPADLADLGLLLLEKGFPKDAERYLKKALKASPKNPNIAYRLGIAQQRQGRERAAARTYARVIAWEPGFAPAQFMLGLAHERMGHRQAAIQHYVTAYRHYPQLADPKHNPLVLTSKLQLEAAMKQYNRVMRAESFWIGYMDPETVRAMQLINPRPARR